MVVVVMMVKKAAIEKVDGEVEIDVQIEIDLEIDFEIEFSCSLLMNQFLGSI